MGTKAGGEDLDQLVIHNSTKYPAGQVYIQTGRTKEDHRTPEEALRMVENGMCDEETLVRIMRNLRRHALPIAICAAAHIKAYPGEYPLRLINIAYDISFKGR